MEKKWKFIFKVRAGQPGFADDEEYESKWFTSFKECFFSYLEFNPNEYFSDLRLIQKELIIYNNSDLIIENRASSGVIFYNDSENDLGITETEFDLTITDWLSKKDRSVRRKNVSIDLNNVAVSTVNNVTPTGVYCECIFE